MLQSAGEIFECLVQHGCMDLSSSLDKGDYSSSPIANGGFGEVWRFTTSAGIIYAVKTLRFRALLEGDDKGAKAGCSLSSH